VILSNVLGSLTNIDSSWTPEKITSELWLDASDASTITGSNPVTQWRDKSGNSRHVTMTSSDPALSGALWNGLDAIAFDGNDVMKTGALTLSLGNLQFATVFSLNSAGPAYQAPFSFEGDVFEFREDNNQAKIQTRTNTGNGDNWRWVPANLFTYSNPFIGSYSYDGSQHSLHVSGSSATSAAQTGTFDVTKMVIGQVPSNILNGVIGEVVLVNSPDTFIRQRLEGYMAHKWGLSANLVAGHPYKNSKPLIYPIIVSVTADDPDNAVGGIDVGDTITLLFDGSTNTPVVTSKDSIDSLISFGSNVLGANYSGTWTGSNVLTITVGDAAGADVGIGQTISVKLGGNLTFSGCVFKSSHSGVLAGDFGP